eukprot:evm.model.NODE_15585_length_3615_cov_17.018810.1
MPWSLVEELMEDEGEGWGEVFALVEVPGRQNLIDLKQQAAVWREEGRKVWGRISAGDDQILKVSEWEDTLLPSLPPSSCRGKGGGKAVAATATAGLGKREMLDFVNRSYSMWEKQDVAPVEVPGKKALEWVWRVADWARVALDHVRRARGEVGKEGGVEAPRTMGMSADELERLLRSSRIEGLLGPQGMEEGWKQGLKEEGCE